LLPIRDTIPSRRYPVVNVLLICANVVVFLYEVSLGPRLEEFIATYGFVPAALSSLPALPFSAWPGVLLTVFTSMFIHGGWVHLIGNMWFLWIFGDNVEDRMGHGRYLVFYLLCGVTATMTQALINPFSDVPMVGASGAISGVLGAYMLLFPHSTVVTLVPLFFFVHLVEIPAFFFLGFWALIQFLQGISTLPYAHLIKGGVAWWAHLGGFICGMILAKPFSERRGYPKGRTDLWPF